jgi:hypothetical protein
MVRRSGRLAALRVRALPVLAVAVVAAGCGTAGDDATVDGVADGTASATAPPAPPMTPAATAPPDVPEVVTTSPRITTIDRPALATTEAERVDAPIRVDWIGGSDVALNEVSLPDAFLQHRSAVDGRPLDLRARTQIGALAPDVEAMIGAALGDRVEALIVSFNPVWLHVLEGSCDTLTGPRERYGCLLTPVSPEITADRQAEIESLMRTIETAGVPVYLYMQPHSADVMADPTVGPLIADAEQRLAAFDPRMSTVAFRARNVTRDVAAASEGSEFHDMVHLTPAGAAVLGAWLAADIGAFWDQLGFAR